MNTAISPEKLPSPRPPQLPEEPLFVVEARKSAFGINLKELWTHRELLYFLVWRDVKIRYKQTLLGAAWAIIQPLLTMVIFTFIFGRVAKIDSNGIPYPVFAYAALALDLFCQCNHHQW
jgi:lipopolysaccharide transport system permease protein